MVGVLAGRKVIGRLIGVVTGVWLMFAPAVLEYGDPAASNDRIFGPIGGAIAFVAIWEIVRPLRWGVVPIGAWLTLAPFVLSYDSTAAIVSSVVAGVVMGLSGFIGGERKQSYGGGWVTLLPGHEVPAADPGDPVG